MNSPFDVFTIPPPAEPVDLEARSLELIRQQRLDEFKARCPAEFRAAIKRELLPNAEAWDNADKWQPGDYPGLWLWSPETGKCKTRMAWRKIGAALCRLGKRHIFVTGTSLGNYCYECFRDGNQEEFVRKFKRHDFVILDDLDKYPLTEERHARALRELFDYFYSEHVSVLVTANEPISHFAGVVGGSCERRLREVCREVRF